MYAIAIIGPQGESYTLSGLTRQGVTESIAYALASGARDVFTVTGGVLPGTFRGTAYAWRTLAY